MSHIARPDGDAGSPEVTSVAGLTQLRVLAPAKINLHLRVGPKRPDGFHPLLSWMATVGLFDTLRIGRERASAGSAVRLTCDDPELPTDGRNLVFKAAVALLDEARKISGKALPGSGFGSGAGGAAAAISDASLVVQLQKRIPSGGGLGGGSSDAATTLLGANRLLGELVPTNRLSELAAILGSDVPFFLHGASSVCRGRGEEVKPIGVRARAKWVSLVLPPIEMPTPSVYRRFDEMNLGRQENVDRDINWAGWLKLAAQDLLPLLVNDLEPPAFSLRPDLDELRRLVEKAASRVVRMSGSGSSLFTLFDEKAQADRVTDRITADLRVKALTVELAPSIDDDLKINV